MSGMADGAIRSIVGASRKRAVEVREWLERHPAFPQAAAARAYADVLDEEAAKLERGVEYDMARVNAAFVACGSAA